MTCQSIFRNERRFQWCISQAYSLKGVARRASLMNFGVGDTDRICNFCTNFQETS